MTNICMITIYANLDVFRCLSIPVAIELVAMTCIADMGQLLSKCNDYDYNYIALPWLQLRLHHQNSRLQLNYDYLFLDYDQITITFILYWKYMNN